MLIVYHPDNQQAAERLATCLSLPCAPLEIHEFPDGELCISLPTGLPEQVVLFCSLDHPNDKLIALILAADAARAAGVRELTLLAPYLCYMRQDKAFHAGQAVSQRSIGKLLDFLFDTLITVDPHLHRIKSLTEILPTTQCITLSAGTAIADFLADHLSRFGENVFLLGPDSESEQWVARIARASGLDYGVAEKIRQGDRQVRINLPEINFAQRNVLLVDDMISTGTTLMQAAQLLRQQHASAINCITTHALLADDQLQYLADAGIGQVISTDSVRHKTNEIALSNLYAGALRPLLIPANNK